MAIFRLIGALVSISLLVGAQCALGADFPAKPMRVIVGYSAGGATDAVARVIARALSERWQQPVVVENHPGAGGNIGANLLAKSPPDGYTILLAAPAHAVNASLYKKLPFDPVADFRTVTLAVRVLNVFVVTPSLPVKSVAEFVQYAKANPRAVNFVSAGVGASSHMAGELFKSLTGIDMIHVPYKGTSAYLIDLTAGRVQAAFDSLPALLPLIQAGKLRAMALSSPTRSPLLPDVPTMGEVGLPEYQVSVWLGFLAPAGTPNAAVSALNQGINEVIEVPAVKKQIADIGGVTAGTTPEEFDAFMRKEIERYREVIVRTGATAQ